MKKATFALLSLTIAFAFVLTGIFIGRNISERITLNENNSSESTDVAKPVYEGKININTATIDYLRSLPGIGEVLAQRIIDYREENGPYDCIEDLMKVSGLGEKRFQDIKDYITVGGQK